MNSQQVATRAITGKATYHAIDIVEARGFDISYGDGYKILDIYSHWTLDGMERYQKRFILLPTGHDVPDRFRDLPVIHTPIGSIVTSSSSQTGLLDALSATDILVGHGVDNIWHPETNRRIQQNLIPIVGTGANLNTELVLSLAPDVYMPYPLQGGNANTLTVLEAAGIAVVPNAEYLEATMLGRAEWLKLIGILLDREAEAERIFNQASDAYHSLQALVAAHVHAKPLVLYGSPNRGTWYQPGRDSYTAELIMAAGGHYPWPDKGKVGSFQVAFEDMLDIGLRADIWLDPRGQQGSLQALGTLDTRLQQLPVYQAGEVYSFTRRTGDNGSNDYWETGMVLPHTILADLIRIMHPQLLPQHTLHYYERLR